jgi:hypothetical protein
LGSNQPYDTIKPPKMIDIVVDVRFSPTHIILGKFLGGAFSRIFFTTEDDHPDPKEKDDAFTGSA